MEGEDGSSSRRVTKKRRGASRQEQGAEPEIDASVRGPLVKRPNFDCDCERPHPNSNSMMRNCDVDTALEADQTVSEDFLHMATPQWDASLLTNNKSKGNSEMRNCDADTALEADQTVSEDFLHMATPQWDASLLTNNKSKGPRKRQCRSNSDCPSGSKDLKLSGLGAPELNPCDKENLPYNHKKEIRMYKGIIRSSIPGPTKVGQDSLFGQAAEHINSLQGNLIVFGGDLSGTEKLRMVLPSSRNTRGVLGLCKAVVKRFNELHEDKKNLEDSTGV